MRSLSLEYFVGQEYIVGDGKILDRTINAITRGIKDIDIKEKIC